MIEQCDLGDNSASLYEYFVTVNSDFLNNDILPPINQLPSWTTDVDFVEVFAKAWKDYTLFVKLTERVFEYMNRYCVNNLGKVHSTEVCFYMFKSEVFWVHKTKLVESVISLILKSQHHRDDHGNR